MKFKDTSINTEVQILKYAGSENVTFSVSDKGIVANEDGKKIVPAGTILPVNDATAKGVLLHDVDVSYGEAPGTIVVHGHIDLSKLPVTPTSEAIKALKLINFCE